MCYRVMHSKMWIAMICNKTQFLNSAGESCCYSETLFIYSDKTKIIYTLNNRIVASRRKCGIAVLRLG